MIKYNNAIYITVCVSIMAYAMDNANELSIIREAMRNLHTAAEHHDISLAAHSITRLLSQRDTLNTITFHDLEAANAASLEPSSFGYAFFYDLIIMGNAELLDIFLEMLDRSYPGIGINWLYPGSSGSFTMLDKAYRLREALRLAGNSTDNIEQVIQVLIDHGGELYANIPQNSAIVGTPPESDNESGI